MEKMEFEKNLESQEKVREFKNSVKKQGKKIKNNERVTNSNSSFRESHGHVRDIKFILIFCGNLDYCPNIAQLVKAINFVILIFRHLKMV